MRLIHTADIHLDTCLAGTGMTSAFGNRRRQSLRDVFASIVDRAAVWPADALLIAGDLFEQDRVTRDTLAFLRSQFERIPQVPIVIAPGNHDPYTDVSPYAVEPWPANVHIFKTPNWDAVPLHDGKLVVHGFAFDGPEVSHNPFGQLSIPEDGACHVAVAHGSERGHQPPEQKSYASFWAQDAACTGLRYLALGHFHAMMAINGPFETAMYYSGAPEAHSFTHTGPRHFLEIELDDNAVQVRPVFSARTLYSTHTIDCTEFESTQQVIDALRALPLQDGRTHVVRVTLRGLCPPSVKGELSAVRDAMRDEWEYLDIVDAIELAEDYDELAQSEGSLGAFIQQINQQLRDASDESDRRVLSRAREVGLAAYRGHELEIRGIG